MARGDLTNSERAQLEPHLPKNTGRGGRWKRHRQVINGILFRMRTGIPWRDLPRRFGSWQTCYDRHRHRHRRWSAEGTWERIVRAVQAGADADGRIDWSLVSVDSTVCRAHQHAAGARKQAPRKTGKRTRPAQHRPDEALGRSRGGLTMKIHLAGEGGLRPCGHAGHPRSVGRCPQMIPVLERLRVPRPDGGHPRTRPDHLSGDKAYSLHRNRRCLRRRQIKHTIPERRDQQAHRLRRGSNGGRPTGFDAARYARRDEVERLINRLKANRAVARCFDKRAYVFYGTVTVAALRLWFCA
ncbi:IS5 family transposase [Streptomyces asiaticus]|uniref:IS5 family transposase n=1 Tax=Streptomyces asiaticus TaxID=114695 RepID=UPI0037FBAE78